MAIYDPKDKREIAPEEDGFFPGVTRAIATVGDAISNIQRGVAMGAEGIADAIATFTGLFGDENYKNRVREWVEQDNSEAILDAMNGKFGNVDITGRTYLWNWISDSAEKAGLHNLANTAKIQTRKGMEELSVLDDSEAGRFVKGLAQSAGGMLFDAALGGAIGSAAGAVAGQVGASASKATQVAQRAREIAGLSSLGVRATGNAAQEALNEGAEYNKALLYGLSRGATEVATEKFVGGGFEKVYGGGFFPNVTKSVAGRAVGNIVGEGLEEVASELADPLEKSIYKGKEALGEYGTGEHLKNVGLSFLSGAAMAGVAGTAQGMYTRKATAANLIQEAITEITNRNNQDANGKLTPAKEAKLNESIYGKLKAAEKYLSGMKPDSRAKFIEDNNLGNMFDSMGKIRPEFARRTWGGQSADGTANGAQARFSAAQIQNISANARYDSERIGNMIDTVNQSEAMQGNTVTVHEGALGGEQSSSLGTMKRIVNNLNQATGNDVAVVVVDSGTPGAFNAFHEKGTDTIVVDSAALESDNMNTVGKVTAIAVEEMTHSTQGRDEQGRMTKGYFDLLANVMDTKQYREIVDALTADGNAYGFTKETYASLEEKGFLRGNQLTAKESELADEIGAQVTAKILSGDKSFIAKYAENHNAAGKMISSLEKVGKWLSRATSKEARAEYKRVKSVKETFLEALAEKGYTYKNGKVISARPPEEKEKGNERFNRSAPIDLSDDTELSQRIGDKTGSAKHKIIQQYVLESLSGEITLSDGIKATVDSRDALHISEHHSADKGVAEVSKIREIVETAKPYAYEDDVDHGKFSYFRYYQAFVKYKNDTFPVYVNVGLTRNNDGYKIYDLTEKIRDTAHLLKGVGRLPDGSITLGNGILDNSVPQTSENVNPKSENISELVDISTDTGSAAPSDLRFSRRTWTESQYATEVDKAAKAVAEDIDVSEEQARKYIRNINGIAKMIANDQVRLDYDPNLDETATSLKPNAEYGYTVDMSTLCAKRLLFTGTFDAIQRALPNRAFNSEEIVDIRKKMMDKGYQVACGICYVESTRREIGTITKGFIDAYKESQKTGKPIQKINSNGEKSNLTKGGKTFVASQDYTPTLADLNTTDIDLVKTEHPEVYDAFLAYMNARGQQKPKLLETRTEYKGEILKHFASKASVEKRNSSGGLRVQSYSDFEVPHMIDMMQIVLDMSRVGLKSQAYTKVPAFADVFGKTGIKINLSLIAKGDGIDAKGNLIFDDIEGMPFDEAMRLRRKFGKNVGTILVGKNDAHIIAAMADSRIDFIIPFHKSSWAQNLYSALGLEGYDDYTNYQNEKPIDKSRKIKNFDPSEYWDYSKTGDENAKIYLAKCREDGRIPKFPQFVDYPGYWKLLIDFKMYDNNGVGSPQLVVKPDFNMEAAKRILDEYEGGHRSFPVATDIVDEVVAEYKDSIRFSLPSNAEELAKKHFGTTTKWRETGYLTTDGTMLDFSGRHWGGDGGGRDVDHMDIADAFEGAEGYETNGAYREEQFAFVNRGNIRIVPETPGINLSVEPTDAQYAKLRNFFALNRNQEIVVDYDNESGKTIDSQTFKAGTPASQIIESIRNHFEEGSRSDLMRFHTEDDNIRFSRTATPTEEDNRYLAAVQNGDTASAQKMVDEAAKNAGYITEHLYHGTPMFGFTDVDVFGSSDDTISFFATNRKEVASGYMPWYEDEESDRYHDDVRRIGTPDKSRLLGLSISYDVERILTEARKVFPEYKKARVGTDAEILAYLKKYWLKETIDAAEMLRDFDLSIGSNKTRQQVRDMCDAVIAASKEDTLDAWKTVGNRYKEFDGIDIPYDANEVRPQILHSRILDGLKQIVKFSNTTAIMLNGQLTTTASIVDRYNSFLGGKTIGMYDLYTKQDNQLVIQCRGSIWNKIPLGKYENEYREWLGEDASSYSATTRDVAAFAKAKGYRSVAFFDIYDNGAYGDGHVISNVYAFFYPKEDVKSADPVTYDENGNVIPLSERFNEQNEDIRFSRGLNGGEDTDALEGLTQGQRKKVVANNTMDRVYTRVEAQDEINRIVDEVIAKKYGDTIIKGGRQSLVDRYWIDLNKSNGFARDAIARKIADYMIENAMVAQAVEEMSDDATATGEEIAKKAKRIRLNSMDSAEVEKMRSDIVNELLTSFDRLGSESTFSRRTQRKIKLSLWNSNIAKELQGYVDGKGEYVAADILNAPEMVEWIKALKPLAGKAIYGKEAREAVERLSAFYNEDNELLDGYLDENVEDAIKFILEKKGSSAMLSTEEMEALHKILAGVKRLYKTYDRITLAGRSVSLTDTAMAAHEQISKARRKATTRTFVGKIKNLFSTDMVEPRVVIESLEGNTDDGILSKAFHDIQNGETKKLLLYMQMMSDIDDFMNRNKKYKKRLFKDTIEFRGQNLTVGQAITLHELAKREQAKLGLSENGIKFEDEKNIKHEIKSITNEELSALAERFNSQDLEFIRITEKFFNEVASEIKKVADKENLGYTNALEEFYFPISRDKMTIRKAVTDTRSMISNMVSLYSYSFNKEVRKNAKNALYVGNVYDIITSHAEQLSSYAALYVPMKSFEQLYNKNIAKSMGLSGVISVRQNLNDNVWDGTDSYISKLMSDISGTTPSENSPLAELIRGMRSSYAKFQLGANVKTFISQVASYPQAFTDLDISSLVKGFSMISNHEEMDKYCPYAAARNYNKGVVKAEGVLDQIGKVGDTFTKPIQVFDRFTIGKLWNACQYQVQKNTGLAVGTEENKVKAGNMLENVIRRTQPDFSVSERSALMRSQNEFARTAVMFTSAQLKQISRLVESIGKLQYAMSTGDAAKIHAAKVQVARSSAAVLMSVTAYALLGMLAKALFARLKASDKDWEEKPEALLKEFGADLISGGVGMLPIVRDIYTAISSKITNNGNGYEINSFYYDILNNVVDAGYKAGSLAIKSLHGENIEDRQWYSTIRDVTNAVGQLTGIPTRNLYNEITGLVKRVSTSAGYTINTKFYNANYVSDINKALENGDEQRATTVMNLMMSERMDGTSTSLINKSVLDLYKKGYTVLPRTVGSSITYDGQEYKLTARQKARFQKVYGQASAAVQKVVSLQSYKNLSDDVKAKTIKRIYDMYYNLAVDDLLGTDTEDKTVLFSYAIDPDKLALIVSQARSIQADTDKNGNAIAGSKKQKVVTYVNGLKLTAAQKYMIMGYLGYRNEKGEEQVKAYINRLRQLSKAEKEMLLEYSGYAA